MSDGEAARLLREVCAAMLADGQPGPELAAWCRRVLDEPGYAEYVIRSFAGMFEAS